MGNLFAHLPAIPWLTGIPVVISLFALLISHRSYRLGYRKAQADHDAARRVPNLSLVVYSARISGSGNYEPPLHFVLDCHLKSGRCVDFPLVVAIENLGQRTASGVGLFLRYPLHLRQWKSRDYEAKVPVVVSEDEDWEVVNFELGDVHPGQKCLLTEHLSVASAVFDGASDVGAFTLGFKLEQRDATAIGGDISVGIIRPSTESRADTIVKLSKLLPPAEPLRPQSLRDKLLDIVARLADQTTHKGQRMIIGRSVLRITYDQALAIPDGSVDRVRPNALVAQCGIQDRRGTLWFPGINARNVFLFHGKIRPEVAGIEGDRVPNLGVHRVTPSRDQSRRQPE